MARDLVIQLLADPGDTERVTVALTVGAAAAAGGTVSLWLAGQCVWLAVPGQQQQPFDAEAIALFDDIAELGRVSVCSRCAARRGIEAGDLRPGARIRGAAEFAEEASADNAQVLVY